MDPSSQATWTTEGNAVDLLSASFQHVTLESKKKERWIPVSSTGMTPGGTRMTPGITGMTPGITGMTPGATGMTPWDAGMTPHRADKGLSLKIRVNNDQIINCNLSVQGEQFAYSVLAVAAVVQSLGLNLSKLPLALENFNVTKGRGNTHKIAYKGKHVCLIDDSYNASPASMKAAIKTLGTYHSQRKVALLGDMLELGCESIKFHTELLEIIIDHNIDKVYTVGKFMLALHNLLPSNIKGIHFDDSHQLKNNLNDVIQDNDVVLIKGSRGMKMDVVVQKFIMED
ncbi:hypothetical protein ASM33_08520 [Wolbachia endosymbiont of Folsomia candida]|nr:hypothetical protein ASM33_08520 [Wolbachia endosymbiont of Folsomia candida]